jgi:hypothetical protein
MRLQIGGNVNRTGRLPDAALYARERHNHKMSSNNYVFAKIYNCA